MKAVWDRARELADKRISRLEKETEILIQKQKETEYNYGLEGAYRRQEKAIEHREQEIKQLEDFKKQCMQPLKTENITLYALYCKECKTTTYVPANVRVPEGRIHDCPVCRKTICGLPAKMVIKIVSGTLRLTN